MAKPPKHRRVGQADRDIGQRIRLRRVEVEMSQHALAEELGLSFQQIQKYEMGVNRFNTQRLQQIATALRVPISFFYDGANAKQEEVESRLPSTPRSACGCCAHIGPSRAGSCSAVWSC